LGELFAYGCDYRELQLLCILVASRAMTSYLAKAKHFVLIFAV